MNERIRQLAADTRGQMVVLTAVDDEEWKRHEEFVEKFAELIVRECALTAGLMEHEGRQGIGAQILDNFGVEE